ncbi:MAG TPA: hypothetical protein VIE15_02270 [Acidimicrobiales bacterium]
MTRRGPRTPIAALAALLAAAGTLGAAAPLLAAPRAPGTTVHAGLAVVQYSATSPAPLPWNAHLLSGADPARTTSSGPRAAPAAGGGIQVAFRNPVGDVIWLNGSAGGAFSSTDLTALTQTQPISSQPVPLVGRGLDEVFCVTTSSHLVLLTRQYVHSGLQRGTEYPDEHLSSVHWARADLTALGGPLVAGTPSVVVQGTTTAVFLRTVSGDLVEYANDSLLGRAWNGYDLSLMAGGPKVTSDPVGFVDPATHQIQVASTELGPVKGDVTVFTPNDVGGRIWTFQDVSATTDTAPSSVGLAGVTYQGNPVLFGAGPTGDLVEYLATATASAETWRAADLTSSVVGAPQIAGAPSVVVAGTHLAVAAVASSWGDLFEWTNTGSAGAWTAVDVSITGAGPTRTVAGRPAIVFAGGVLSMYAAGVAVPAPEGTGVYAIPWTKWAQALRDGWPVLGVTGGLGAQCAPWTSISAASTPPDEYVGQTIQASHQRETWLSFWTVSGPRTAPGSTCTAEKGTVTAKTYYAHGAAAGAFVATEIDSYRAAGIGLKPDWVIFDPEGYPDNHSGLWGPTSPPARLNASVANWYAMLAGWRAGIASVDPSLRAGLYANQYEYMTYRLYNQPLPSFIAGSFAEQIIKGKRTLVAPSRTAFGPNIRGFVMFNQFAPTCTEVTNERLILTEAPWNGAYNTVQIQPGSYCPPGP